MRCDQVTDLLPDRATGRLDSTATASVDAHLRECATCRDELEVLRLLADAGPRAAPDGLRERVSKAAIAAAAEVSRSGAFPVAAGTTPPGRDDRKVVPIRPRPRGIPSWALGAAAVVVLAIGTPTLVDRIGREAGPVQGTVAEFGIEDPVTTVWASEDGLLAGAPALDLLTDEELALLLEEMEG